ncbi:hypothetical protein BDV19DRAFT_392948 [Aspergillus venezuelensis]
MEQVRKTFFNPLATSKSQIRDILQDLPVGSAHPYSPERVLLCRTANGITEIDISSYPDDYFFNAVNLEEMGETLLRRMAGFKSHLGVFDDFQIMQAPAFTFKIPIVSGQITIFAVSERTPTYYDLCFADASYNVCCFNATHTFKGINHSGDITNGQDFLAHITLDQEKLTDKEICVFISGYHYTHITRFLGTHPALLVADHVDKMLYTIPVPLDAVTIGDSTICSTTDVERMCSGKSLKSPSFPEAIQRADFTISAPPRQSKTQGLLGAGASDLIQEASANLESMNNSTKEHAVIATHSANLPPFLNLESSQIIRFGTGIEFHEEPSSKAPSSAVVLPCIFGSELQGPILLATGTVPSKVPYADEIALRNYYSQLKSAVVIVDEKMTDNARNIANAYRINALFIVQLNPTAPPTKTEEVVSLLNAANINAVTALAGPQSLVLGQIGDKYHFYRGLVDQAYLNINSLEFGADVTAVVESVGVESLLDPRIERIVTLGGTYSVLLPSSGQRVRIQDLERLFEDLSVDQLRCLEKDISAAVTQLQALMNQKDLQALSKALVSKLSLKIDNEVAPLRICYINYLKEYNRTDPESVRKKGNMLGKLRRTTKEIQTALEPLISSLSNIISSQTTLKRTHDLKRLVRQAQTQSNVDAVKSMTFETLAGYLENYAADMGVMLLNIQTEPYCQLLGNLKANSLDVSPACSLDPRVLHLEGFDAGIIIEQSQGNHEGPLVSQSGPSHPTLALPYLSQESGTGSMLAWVCWDEFVNLKNPYSVRWMEKCNEAHIAALRIIMRSTLSQAVSSREYDMQPENPETGRLMSALLMSAMSKLGAMRTSTPVESTEAEDTVTKLMRGLFGNLLTIAGSGVRPLSMVWQLFGINSQNDLPKTDADWIWYETVVALYQYTGWPRKQFYANLEKLLDKAIIRVVTANEDIATLKVNRIQEMINYCKLRNIQLHHSRSIITVLMRMLTAGDDDATLDLAAVATRLLTHLPRKIENPTSGYIKMFKYLKNLQAGGQRRPAADLVFANTYNARSAVFSGLKSQVAEAGKSRDWDEVKSACQKIKDKHAELASLWRVDPGTLTLQNQQVYSDLLTTDLGNDSDTTKKLCNKVYADAEIKRVPWQVGKEGEFGDESIEPLDEYFVQEMLTGEKKMAKPLAQQPTANTWIDMTEPIAKPTPAEVFAPFKSVLRSSFVTTMQKEHLSAEEVCRLINITPSAMRVFVKALNPVFVWTDLGERFKDVILDLLNDRANRAESCPTARLLGLGDYENVKMLE